MKLGLKIYLVVVNLLAAPFTYQVGASPKYNRQLDMMVGGPLLGVCMALIGTVFVSLTAFLIWKGITQALFPRDPKNQGVDSRHSK